MSDRAFNAFFWACGLLGLLITGGIVFVAVHFLTKVW